MQMILTVQSLNKKRDRFRLGVSLSDSINIFKKRHVEVRIKLCDAIEEIITTTCGFPLPKGFGLYCKELSAWIIRNEFHIYPRGKPTKLNFKYSNKNGTHKLIFINRI